MSWTKPTINQIYDRVSANIRSRLLGGTAVSKVSFLGLIILGFSGAVYTIYCFIERLYAQFFPDTADAEGLQRWANIRDVQQKNAEYATGAVSFTGTTDHVIPAGTIVISDDGYEYETDAAYTIPASPSTTVSVTAVVEGEASNTEDTELSLSTPNDDIDSAVNVESGFADGQDLESVENWASRIVYDLKFPPSSGNRYDYIRWASGVAGVGKAWCLPEYTGSGSVGLVVADEELQPVTAGTLAEVETYIEAERPIPAEVTYLNSVALPTEYQIAITPNTADVQAAIEAQLLALHLQEAGPGETILLSHIRAAINAGGPTDYEIVDIDVDGTSIGVDEITTAVPNIAVYTNATFSTL